MRMEKQEITEENPRDINNDSNDANCKFQRKNPGES
jgi:hypothetical protein